MADEDDDGRVYTGLDLAFDKEHHARASERGEVSNEAINICMSLFFI
jgi:hypothetical protein